MSQQRSQLNTPESYKSVMTHSKQKSNDQHREVSERLNIMASDRKEKDKLAKNKNYAEQLRKDKKQDVIRTSRQNKGLKIDPVQDKQPPKSVTRAMLRNGLATPPVAAQLRDEEVSAPFNSATKNMIY
jgi:hypothetical protein